MIENGVGVGPCFNNTYDGGGEPSPYLDGVEPSTVFQLSSAIEASTDGADGFYNNIVPFSSPNSAYDFEDMEAVDDDTAVINLVGTAGTQSAYHNLDGSQYWRLNGTNPDPLKHACRSGTSGWFAIAWQTADSTSDGVMLLDTRHDDYTGTGIFIRKQGNEKVQMYVANPSGTAFALSSVQDVPLSTDTVTLVSWDGSNVNFWVDRSGTKETKALVFPTNTTSESTQQSYMLANYAEGNRNNSSNQIYGMAYGTAFIDSDAQAVAMMENLETMYNRTFLA